MHAWSVVLLLAIAAPSYADPGDRWDPGTMGLQVVVGGLSGLGGAAVLGTVGLGIGIASSSGKNDWFWPVVLGAAGAGIGGVTGTVLGVGYMGERRGSTGHWWGTAVGLVGGAFLMGGVMEGFDAVHVRPPGGVVIALGLLTFFGGAVIGYQLSASERAPVMPIAALVF